MNKKTKREWELEFITALVRSRDFFLQQEAAEQVGIERAQTVNNILVGYFCERRERAFVPYASCYMSNEDIAVWINDIVLEYLSEENPGFLILDWQQKYILKSEEEDISFEDLNGETN